LNNYFKKVRNKFGRLKYIKLLFSHGTAALSGPEPPRYRGLMITLRHTALGRTPLAYWSAWRRDLYLTTHNHHRDRHPWHRRDSNLQSQASSH